MQAKTEPELRGGALCIAIDGDKRRMRQLGLNIKEKALFPKISFESVSTDSSWSFAEKTRRETSYLTHGYHRYPAKFIPQIAARLIQKYSNTGDTVVDVFAGCATTLVEAKVLGRVALGVDINPVAVLIAKAKTAWIDPAELEKEYLVLKDNIAHYHDRMVVSAPMHERIDYWFNPPEKNRLAFIFAEIANVQNQTARDLFYCGFSNTLKNCSIWMQKSNKPTRDFNKIPADPYAFFLRQIRAILRGNAAFVDLLKERNHLKIRCRVHCTDARNIPTKDNSVNLIVTSPPYVTSYEYADLHQLTALWFNFAHDLKDFRKRFIGTAHHQKKQVVLNSSTAEIIQKDLLHVSPKKASEVANYFSEMNAVFLEMRRILKTGGYACIVIGDTKLKGVQILNSQVFLEQLQAHGFAVEEIIKREIPSKNLPSTRDKITGRFAKSTDTHKTLAYPTEYILVMRKQ